jgi:predicted nucleic acid-binding Zn ribbon protein
MAILNFYAKKWKEISEESKDTPISIPAIPPPNNDKILSAILELTDYADRLT